MTFMPSDLIRLMRSLFLPPAELRLGESWQPAVDVSRTRRGWLIKAELAGVRPEDIRVTAAGNRLSIQGTRRDWLSDEGCCHYRMEITYSKFERTLELPCDLERARITTDYQYGLLLVRVETEAEK
jgi:HSP20 family protein